MPYNDNFTDANGTLIHNHTADSGQSYATNAGLKINTNRLYPENTSVLACEVLSFSTGDYYNIDLSIYERSATARFGIMFSSDASGNNGYWFRVLAFGQMQLYRRSGGGSTLLGSYSDPGFSWPTAPTINITIRVTPTNIYVDYNGATRITSGDTTHARDASLGFFNDSASTSTTGYHLDSILWTDTTPAPPAVLSNPNVPTVTPTSAVFTCDSDEGSGTLYVWNDTEATNRDATFIKTNATQSQAVTASGQQTVNLSSLITNEWYFVQVAQENSGGLSNVVRSLSIHTPKETFSYPEGVYPMALLVTAPDMSTDTDTGTLTVVPPRVITANQTEEGDSQSAQISAPATMAANQAEEGDSQLALIQNVVSLNPIITSVVTVNGNDYLASSDGRVYGDQGGPPPASPSIAMELFDYTTIPVNYQQPQWNQYEGDPTEGPDPGSEAIDVGGGIFGDGNALEITVDSGNVYMQHYTAVSSVNINYWREFVAGYQLDTYNRIRFWAKLPPGMTLSGGGNTNLHFGTYFRATTGDRSDFEDGGNHYYHYHNVESNNGAWHQFIIDWHPTHIRGQNGNTEHGTKQYPTSEAGYNYLDLLTRTYFDAKGAIANGSVFLFDGFEAYYDPNDENIEQIYSLNGVYDPVTGKISINWNRDKTENAIDHEVRYAFSSFFENGGWSHGTAAPSGTVSPLGSGGYNQMNYDTTGISVGANDAVYMAIKPTNSARFREIKIPITAAGYPTIGGS